MRWRLIEWVDHLPWVRYSKGMENTGTAIKNIPTRRPKLPSDSLVFVQACLLTVSQLEKVVATRLRSF